MKRAVTSLVGIVFLASASVPAAARHKSVSGSFEASAVPLPMLWFVEETGCNAGIEGVHKTTHRFKAPFPGWLTAELAFTGEWWLQLVNQRGRLLAYADHEAGKASLRYYLQAGQQVGIVACNWAGASNARGTYTLDHDATPRPLSSTTYSWTHRMRYRSPALATAHVSVICLVERLGCVGTDVLPTDRFVSVKVEDDISPMVAGGILQFLGGTYLGQKKFCGSRSIELEPGVDWVSVTLYAGPCQNGTPATATTGEVKMTFSNRR